MNLSRLKAIRERSGVTVDEIVCRTGLDRLSYLDLENIEGELCRNISLGELKLLGKVLAINPRVLFDEKSAVSEKLLSFGQLAKELSDHLKEKKLSIDQFELLVGFGVRKCLENPETIAEWNIDCLKSVCNDLGIEWRCFL